MINTIEVAPAILAASLAKHLKPRVYEFIDIELDDPYAHCDLTLDEETLRELIRDFLNEPTK